MDSNISIECIYTYKLVVPPITFSKDSIGTLCASSDDGSQTSLDWAMIELNAQSIQKLKTLVRWYPYKIGAKQLQERKVYTYSGSCGLLLGSMSSNQTLLKLPGTQTFQEVWVVRFDGALCESSGYWAEYSRI
jgi:hypothetical protein